jgi:predicted RNA-binding protein with PUA-like domain
MKWLMKEEPTHYGFEDLVRDGRTSWTGVRNPLAQRHLRSIRKGDEILYYHTGDEKAVVGVAKAVSEPYPDPADQTGSLYAIDVAPVRKLKTPITLAAVKADRSFADFPLVRIPRLSVMPVSEAEWERMQALTEDT